MKCGINLHRLSSLDKSFMKTHRLFLDINKWPLASWHFVQVFTPILGIVIPWHTMTHHPPFKCMCYFWHKFPNIAVNITHVWVHSGHVVQCLNGFSRCALCKEGGVHLTVSATVLHGRLSWWACLVMNCRCVTRKILSVFYFTHKTRVLNLTVVPQNSICGQNPNSWWVTFFGAPYSDRMGPLFEGQMLYSTVVYSEACNALIPTCPHKRLLAYWFCCIHG